MAQAGLSFANPFMEKTSVGEPANPYAPFSPTSSIGMGGLGPSLADMAVTGQRLVQQSQFTLPEFTLSVISRSILDAGHTLMFNSTNTADALIRISFSLNWFTG